MLLVVSFRGIDATREFRPNLESIGRIRGTASLSAAAAGLYAAAR